MKTFTRYSYTAWRWSYFRAHYRKHLYCRLTLTDYCYRKRKAVIYPIINIFYIACNLCKTSKKGPALNIAFCIPEFSSLMLNNIFETHLTLKGYLNLCYACFKQRNINKSIFWDKQALYAVIVIKDWLPTNMLASVHRLLAKRWLRLPTLFYDTT